MGYSPQSRKESDTTERLHLDFPGGASGKESVCQCGRWDAGSIPGKEGTDTHSNIFA